MESNVIVKAVSDEERFRHRLWFMEVLSSSENIKVILFFQRNVVFEPFGNAYNVKWFYVVRRLHYDMDELSICMRRSLLVI